MSIAELVEKIRALPATEQRALAETILRDVTRAEQTTKRERGRRQMEESAKDALEYYLTDPDVAIWREMEPVQA